MVGNLDEHVSLPAELLEGFEGKTRAFLQVGLSGTRSGGR